MTHQPVSEALLRHMSDLWDDEKDVCAATTFMDAIETAMTHPEWAQALLAATKAEGLPSQDVDWPSLIPLEARR